MAILVFKLLPRQFCVSAKL